MATTNLQQWNPTAVNQENDAAYAADSQRSGGATNPSIFQAELANKLFYQTTTFLTALFTAFANKGFTTSDSNLSTLTATCANFLTTADKISVATAQGGPLISAEQLGGAYGSTVNTAAIVAGTQGADPNYLFAGLNSSNNPVFWVQATGLVTALGLQSLGAIIGVSASISGAFSAATAAISSALTAASATISGFLQVNGGAQVNNNLNVGSFQIGGTAPSGQVLTGNGSSYVPAVLAIQATPSDVTGSRAFGVTYQNTTSRVMFVSGYGRTSGSSIGSMQGLIGPSGPSTAVWGNTTAATVNNGASGFYFAVPPGWYYQVNANNLTNGQGSAVTSVTSWVETTVGF